MKITINNEEVLCNKDFTINEEMLNTSSVILNNVYPATWEQDKDYVSRFYYPKDYSKCKIFNEIYHPEEKSTASGTSFTLNNVDLDKEYYIEDLKGQTTQEGTPTPTSPQPINITTGRQVVRVCGKNLFNDTLRQGVTVYNTGEYSSTTTARITSTDWITLKAGTYTISAKTTNTGNRYLQVSCVTFDTNGNFYNISGVSGQWQRLPFTFTTPIDLNWKCNIGFSDSIVITPSDVYDIQLEKGTTATTYEEYKGQDYEINLGKNMANINDIQVGRYWDGNVMTTRASILNIPITPNTQYSIVGSWTNSHITQVRVVTFTNIGDTTHKGVFSGTFTTPQTANYLSVEVLADTTFTSEMLDGLKIMLCKGSETIDDYAPYETPIYLGKIGTYQDYIFKNTTENPLYDSTLEEGQWYIHKEIGKKGFTGASGENWVLDSSHSRFSLTGYINDYMVNQRTTALCNYYKYGNTELEGYFALSGSNNVLFMHYPNSSTNTAALFKTWLSTHNVEVYYVLNTPTNTLIEDEELINQLNSIELLEGLNNVSLSSPNLPFIMDLVYNYVPAYTEEDMLFCGVVENTGNISLNPRYPHYCNLQVLDFKTFLSEGETLDFVIYEKTVEEAINQVIGTINEYGFILGNVNILHGNDVIGAYSTKDKTAYDVFNYLADITQSRWTTRMINENLVAIDFYDPTLMPQGTKIKYTQEWFCNNKIQDMSFSYSSRDYRNKQVMLSGEVYANIETTEIIVADGYQTQFNTTDKIGYVSSILLNGSPMQVITKEEYDLGYEGDFIYQPGNAYFESVELVSTGAIITIVYYAVIEGREVLLNQEEISRVNEMIHRKGIIARYENRNDATTTQELQAIGQSYLKYKGSPEVILKIESLENIWNIGERVEFEAPLEELSTEYMVKKKTINYITTQDNVFYTYELSSSFNSETEINYFDNQRSKMMGNIGVGEVVSRNIDIENTANVIFYGLEINQVSITSNDSLQGSLQTTLGGRD